MQVSLAYGRQRLTIDLPAHAVVISPVEPPGLPGERAAFTAAVRQPVGSPALRTLVRESDHVAIVIADITRPSPSERLVPWILEELDYVPRQNIVILNGTGSHRANTRLELVRMLGAEVVESVRIANHDAFNAETLSLLGRLSTGGDVWLNREYLEADVRIVTGFIEPHFFAGFSGGPKGIVPGLAGIQTIMHLHSAQMIGHPGSTWMEIDNNPIQAGIRQMPFQHGYRVHDHYP